MLLPIGDLGASHVKALSRLCHQLLPFDLCLQSCVYTRSLNLFGYSVNLKRFTWLAMALTITDTHAYSSRHFL